jgi:antirestriction protein ArdC
MKAYEVITDRIIAALEQGIVPWRRPWRSSTDAPRSFVSKRPYRGINVLMLTMTAQAQGYSSPLWLTFNQAKKQGGSIRKGEKGTPVVLWKFVETKDKTTGEKKTVPFLRYFTVFNAEQTEGIEIPSAEELPEHEPLAAAEDIIEAYLAADGPTLAHGGDSAHYQPDRDHVQLPRPEQFTAPERYYATAFHELGHSTGHEKRLARTFGRFGSGPYSREELVAEMTAVFLLSEAEIEVELEQSAAYIKSWLRALEDDNKLVVTAATAAQKAADLILGRAKPEEQADETPELAKAA